MSKLTLTNTLTRTRERFQPIDETNVRMYVCGPTVYDYAHIGNARPVVAFDVLFRYLRHVYGEACVTYVRNITDVDDKINQRALRDHPGVPLNEAIARVTKKTADQFHRDVEKLGCLSPSFEPRATAHIEGMVAMAQTLIDKGHAYVAEGSEGFEVLFDTGSMASYGQLSGRKLEDQQAGARIAVEAHKKNPGDFVLWKQSEDDQPGWPGSFRQNGETIAIYGRPGWHIECSVMSRHHLGETFDIHGGGLDLIFPHHENEIAQSCCAHGTSVMANTWLHNGFVQVEGQKMSKSLGNFVTMHDLLETVNFGGRKWPGAIIRLALMMTHYREPLDFSQRRLEEAERLYQKWPETGAGDAPVPQAILDALADDLNTVAAVQALHALASTDRQGFAAGAALLGIVKKAAVLDQTATGEIDALVATRLSHIRDKNWAEADRIRDVLVSRGIQLMDGKNPETGERITTWEVKA